MICLFFLIHNASDRTSTASVGSSSIHFSSIYCESVSTSGFDRNFSLPYCFPFFHERANDERLKQVFKAPDDKSSPSFTWAALHEAWIWRYDICSLILKWRIHFWSSVKVLWSSNSILKVIWLYKITSLFNSKQ